MRRYHHTSVTASSGKVYIVGGQKTDGSDNVVSDHYVFDPSVPAFTQLPSENGPQAITRHGSAILPNGQLLVFGGYSTATSSLVPFSTIWSLDITNEPPTWSILNVSAGSLPSPRRDFAYTVLPGSRLLIHGGIDGDVSDQYSTVFSDGWFLEVIGASAVWTPSDPLSQLGQRFDHFAISFGPIVFFGFGEPLNDVKDVSNTFLLGYGPSQPAPAPLQIYNSSGSGSFIPTYTPPSLSQSPTPTLPGQPGETSAAGQTSPMSTSFNPTSTPTSTGAGGNPANQREATKKTTGLAVGIALGVLGLLGLATALFIFFRKRRREELFRQSFMALHGQEEDDSPTSGMPVRANYAEKNGQPSQGWRSTLRNLGVPATLGLFLPVSRARSPPPRRDMLADEDTRSFTPYRTRQGSTWSLRSMLGRRSREPSTLSTTGRWGDKDPFSDGAALMADEETGFVGAAVSGAPRPTPHRDYSYTSTMSGRSYVDPFADPIHEEPYEESFDSSSIHPHLHLQTLLPLSTEPHILSPVTEVSRNTSSFGTPSVSSHNSSQEPRLTPFENASGLTSATSANSRSPRPSSIIDAIPGSSQHVRRSDSWWARFSRTSFLDRGNDANRVKRPLDFRDPNPPPRLMAIEESQHSTSPENDKDSPGSHRSNSLKHGLSSVIRKREGHAKSTSSLHTADSEAIERVAAMDVAQHERTGSNRTRDSTRSTSMQSGDQHWLPQEDDSTEGSEQVFTSPVAVADVTGHQDYPLTSVKTPTPPAPTPAGTSATSSATSLFSAESKRPPPSTGVSARVREYERRLSQDMEVVSPTNTKHIEERLRKQSRVGYGLVPRPGLFIANPDNRQPSSSSIDT